MGYERRVTLLDGVVADGSSAAFDAGAFEHVTAHVHGISTANVDIEGSNEEAPTNWENLSLQLSADGILATIARYKWIRLTVSSYSSGTIYGEVYGYCKG